jgi:hypothetical protein
MDAEAYPRPAGPRRSRAAPPPPCRRRRVVREDGAVRLDGIRAGDIVRCSVKGRMFHAVVRGEASPGPGLRVDPIERGVSYRHVRARDVVEHWAKRGRGGGGERDVHPEQRSLEDLWDR